MYFNPRSPHGERPFIPVPIAVGIYFNPRSPHGERQADYQNMVVYIAISIHALLTESDEFSFQVLQATGEFQSTLSSRRAT